MVLRIYKKIIEGIVNPKNHGNKFLRDRSFFLDDRSFCEIIMESVLPTKEP